MEAGWRCCCWFSINGKAMEPNCVLIQLGVCEERTWTCLVCVRIWAVSKVLQSWKPMPKSKEWQWVSWSPFYMCTSTQCSKSHTSRLSVSRLGIFTKWNSRWNWHEGFGFWVFYNRWIKIMSSSNLLPKLLVIWAPYYIARIHIKFAYSSKFWIVQSSTRIFVWFQSSHVMFKLYVFSF